VAGGAAHDTLSMSRVAWECSPKLVFSKVWVLPFGDLVLCTLFAAHSASVAHHILLPVAVKQKILLQ